MPENSSTGNEAPDRKEQMRHQLANLQPAKEHIDELMFNLLSHATPFGNEHVLEKFLPKGFQKDNFGNLLYRIGKKSEHKTMFSCHLDTVHGNPERIIPVIDNDYVFAIKQDEKPSILGADDKVGVWLMANMIKNKVPGLYVFHLGEEVGCRGSRHISEHSTELLAGIDRCVALDRKGYDSIITFQRSLRCCSEEFSEKLAEQLIEQGDFPPTIKWKSDPTGVLTDSATYMEQIPECTNLSVGYFNQHGEREHFDYLYVKQWLLPALMNVNWAELPTKRDKSVREERYRRNYSNNNHNQQQTPWWAQQQKANTVPYLKLVTVNENNSVYYGAQFNDPKNVWYQTEWPKIKLEKFSGIPKDAKKENFTAIMMAKIVQEGMKPFLGELFDFLKKLEEDVTQMHTDAKGIIEQLHNRIGTQKLLIDEQEQTIQLFYQYAEQISDTVDEHIAFAAGEEEE